MAIPHHLTQGEALKRVKTLLGEVKSQFADKISDLREEWNGNTGKFSFSAMGLSVSGTLTVNHREMELSGDLPFAASFFGEKIESMIRERAETLLAAGGTHMQRTQVKYGVGAKVIFRPKHGTSARTGQKARVFVHGNGTDESGVAHGIKFADGHILWAYPQELTPDTEK